MVHNRPAADATTPPNPATLTDMPRPPRPAPNAGDTDGWPARIREDPIQETARRFVNNVLNQMGDSSIRSIASQAGIDHNVLRLVLAGESWPDLITIAKLERSLQAELWPGIVE
jgi:hypothetical protein